MSNSLLKIYNQFDINISHGEGVNLFDINGKKYTDLLSGIAVCGLGYNNNELNKIAIEQLNKVWHTSNLFHSSKQSDLAEKLCYISGLDKVFFCNSGTEANEAAIKFTRKYGNGKYKIITAKGSFHGRTMGSLSASAQEKLWEGFHPLTPGFVSVPYNDLNSLKDAIDKETIAVMLEPIQGENGVVTPSSNYLKEVRELCDKNNLLLIIDEIQTGIGRTGKYFAFQHDDILPDIVTAAKGIANGLPLGAVLLSDKVAEKIPPGAHGSTFGGNPVAVSVANKVLEIIDNSFLNKIDKIGNYLLNQLNGINNPLIENIRGKGLMIGIQINSKYDVKQLAKKIIAKNFLVGTAGNNVLRLLPPLIIDKENIDDFVYILKDLFNNMYN